jgi:8-oxo-dGTP diphosphatase
MKPKNKSMSGLVLINEKTQELLFQLRPKNTKWNPNVWGFFGGKNENNETKEECLVREIKEEIYLDLNINELNLLKTDIFDETDSYFFYHIIKPEQIKHLKLLEGQDWIWTSFEKALELDFGRVTDWNKNFLNNEIKLCLNKIKKLKN